MGDSKRGAGMCNFGFKRCRIFTSFATMNQRNWGGKRKGSGRKPGPGTKRAFWLDDQLLSIVDAMPDGVRSHFARLALSERWKRGAGANVSTVEFCAEMLKVDAGRLRSFVSRELAKGGLNIRDVHPSD